MAREPAGAATGSTELTEPFEPGFGDLDPHDLAPIDLVVRQLEVSGVPVVSVRDPLDGLRDRNLAGRPRPDRRRERSEPDQPSVTDVPDRIEDVGAGVGVRLQPGQDDVEVVQRSPVVRDREQEKALRLSFTSAHQPLSRSVHVRLHQMRHGAPALKLDLVQQVRRIPLRARGARRGINPVGRLPTDHRRFRRGHRAHAADPALPR